MNKLPTQPPSEFICPLTKKVFREPMMSKEGINFEKDAILYRLNQGKMACPVTGTPLRPSSLVSNKALEWKIRSYRIEGNEEKRAPEEDGRSSQEFVVLVPGKFRCSLTNEVMRHPTVTREGISFEREVILNWLEKKDVCPITGNPLRPTNVIPNHKLEWDIKQWQEKNGGALYAMVLGLQDSKLEDTKEKGTTGNTTIISRFQNAMKKATGKMPTSARKPTNARSA